MLSTTTPASLKTRFLWIAAIVLSLVIIATMFGVMSLSQLQQEVSGSLSSRRELLNITNKIRQELLEAYRGLDTFLMDPGREDARDRSIESIQDASLLADTILEHQWTRASGQVTNTIDLKSRLEEIRHHILLVFVVRTETTQQYPAMAVGNQVMNPARDQVDNAFLIIFAELSNDNTIVHQPGLYVEFVETRRLWMQMLSNFRNYLANRVGSFDEKALDTQEKSVATLFDELNGKLKALQKYKQHDKLGFESTAALAELEQGIQKWYQGFVTARDIHHSGEWRIDAKMVQQDIIPTLDSINQSLVSIESVIEQKVDDEVQAFSSLASKHMYLLWMIATVFVLFVAIILWSGHQLLFKPLRKIASALHDESMGKKGMELPLPKIAETRELVEAFSEMQFQVHQRQAELEYRALHDGLTALPNRVLLMDHIQHDIALSKRDLRVLSLMIIDLDHFKEINDTLGHTIGDQVLIEVGNRFKACLRDCDTVARLGGDEFAVLLPNTGTQGARKIAEDIIHSLQDKLKINDMQLFVTASIGIAEYPAHASDAQMLLQHADVAMYQAKQNQAGYALYNPEEDHHSIKRLAILNDFRSAIERSELTLYYQPIIAAHTQRVIGCEALLRWFSDKHGEVSPELMIDLAEKTALIGPLTDWVIKTALTQASQWRESGLDLYVSVNLSMQNLREETLVERIRDQLAQSKLPSELLSLELTESAMMFNPNEVIKVLNELDKMGVQLAIDDFGTGFSSLAYLKQLPVDQVKIDKSFIKNLATDIDDQAIVKATLGLAQNLGMLVVVEGVEDAAAWQMLKELSCFSGQGYYFSRALPAQEFVEFLHKQNSENKIA